MTMIDVFCIIVTYSNRFSLLEQVMEACFDEGVKKIIVVDNGSEKSSRESLRAYEAGRSETVRVIHHQENQGSAGGYKAGLEAALKDDECDFIWLLDDDNKPKRGSLNKLLDFWSKQNMKDKKEKVALLSYRAARTAYREAIMTSNPDFVLHSPNSFQGFHVFEFPAKVIRVLKRRFGKALYDENINIRSGRISLAPYGGLFLHRKLVEKIGLPDDKYFVYKDDHEWTYRITHSGGSIFLMLDSELDDIDHSWDIKSKKETKFDVLGKGTPFRLYYNVRNRIFFERKYLVTSEKMYIFNMKLFLAIFSIISLVRKYNNKPILLKAVRDGFENRSGKTF